MKDLVEVRLDVILGDMRYGIAQRLVDHNDEIKKLVAAKLDAALSTPAVMAVIEDEVCRALEEAIRLKARQMVADFGG